MRTRPTFLLIACLLLVACGLAACGSHTTPSATPVAVTPTENSTPSPNAPAPLVILVLPKDMAQKDKDSYQKLVYDLAQANGMRWQVLNALSPAELTLVGPALKLVVALPPDPGLGALAAAASGVQFLAVGIPDLPTAPNLSSIGSGGMPVDQQAFLAGYIAGMVAPEWKVGVLYMKDTPDGTTARDAFANGFTYYCGSCRNPLFPQPAGIYPYKLGIPKDAKPGEYMAYSDVLLHYAVKVVYVDAQLATPDLLSYMAQINLLLVGQSLPGEDVKANWIASIQPDIVSAVKKIFPDLIAGQGGKVLTTPLFLTDVNPDLLSAGKLRLAQQVLDGLQNGTIGTGVGGK